MIVPYVELPLVTPFTVQVTPVFKVPDTEATADKVPLTVTFTVGLEGVVMETATTGVGEGAVPPPPPQPAITIRRLKLIPKAHILRRRTRAIDPTPIKPEFRVSSFDIKGTRN